MADRLDAVAVGIAQDRITADSHHMVADRIDHAPMVAAAQRETACEW